VVFRLVNYENFSSIEIVRWRSQFEDSVEAYKPTLIISGVKHTLVIKIV